MLFSTLVTAAFAATAFSSPISVSNVLHEKRTELPYGWSKASELSKRAILPVRIALAQSNLEKGGDWLDDVSNPDVRSYSHSSTEY
jgi:tripeptidyl-peptidase I